MTGVAASLERAAHDLGRLGARWALVGGFAVSARAEPRFTRDVDLCVLVADDEEAERITNEMVGLGYAIDAIVEHEQHDRLATARLVSPVGGGVPVGLLFASSGVESDVIEGAEDLEILPGLVMPVARAAHLVVLKLLAHDDASRPQDGMDLASLRAILQPSDEDEVRRLAVLVMDRGYGRDRDLLAMAEAYLAR